jgi:hypothetical protein
MISGTLSKSCQSQIHVIYTAVRSVGWVPLGRQCVLPIITAGGKWVEITIPTDPLLYQRLRQLPRRPPALGELTPGVRRGPKPPADGAA